MARFAHPLIKVDDTARGAYKVAAGVASPDSASFTVVTGLKTVVAVVAQFAEAPTVNAYMCFADKGDQTGTPAAGSILLKQYTATDAAGSDSDATPTAATTGYLDITWLAIGT